jgi:hypothetical protein
MSEPHAKQKGRMFAAHQINACDESSRCIGRERVPEFAIVLDADAETVIGCEFQPCDFARDVFVGAETHARKQVDARLSAVENEILLERGGIAGIAGSDSLYSRAYIDRGEPVRFRRERVGSEIP